MSNIQKYFIEFHDKIKLGDYDENKTLRDKRDSLIKDLRERIDDDVPQFESFDQGSYAMNTGTNPKDGNYDIDVGLIFDCDRNKYSDPVELKKKVRDALSYGKRTVRIRRPCVTVEYLKSEEVDYHVDLAIYVKRPLESTLDIAMGKEFSEDSKRVWEKSDPKGLIDTIKTTQADTNDRAQMRRIVRYLKRWRDKKLISGKPLSIALTCCAYHWFQPKSDIFSNEYDDLNALLSLVETTISRFDIREWLTISLPVVPYDDLNGKMTVNQMQTFKDRLEELRDALKDADKEDLQEDACKILRKQLGEEFPVPEKKNAARKVATAGFAPAGASA